MKDKLQIYLITYNRKENLRKTLNQILAEDSPIKDFSITILDNASTDGTSELIEEYCQTHTNLTHIRHGINIGGNANICRAFEMSASSGKKYTWIICDDDEYDWDGFKEIEEKVMSEDYDIVLTCKSLKNPDLKLNLPSVLFILAFLPSGIYKTEHITESVIANMYGNINTWYTQGVLSIDILVNKNGRYYIPSANIVKRVSEDDIEGNVLTRGQEKKDVHYDLNRMYWHIGYMRALRMVHNKKKRQELSIDVHFDEKSDTRNINYLIYVLDYNKIYRNGNKDNYWDIFSSVPLRYKWYVIYYVLLQTKLFKILTYPILIALTSDGVLGMDFFGGKIKTKLFDPKWLKFKNK